MKLIAYKGYAWEADDWFCGLPDDFDSIVTVEPNVLRRAGTMPTLGLGSYTERTIPGQFVYMGSTPIEAAKAALKAKLQLFDPNAGALEAEFNDGSTGTIQAVIIGQSAGQGGEADFKSVVVQFMSVDPVWAAATPATVGPTTITGATQQTMTVPATGYGQQDAIVELQQTAVGTTSNETAGWRKRQKYKISQTSGRTLLKNTPIAIAFGNTATLVTASKMLASGNDLRVIYQGAELARNLVGINTTTTTIWIRLPVDLPSGSTGITLEFWYGNASAGTPTTLTGDQSLLLDAANSSNAAWTWLVDRTSGNAGLGGWRLSSGTAPPTDKHDMPDAWKIATTKAANDDAWQAKYSSYTASGTKYIARFEAYRLYQKADDFDGNQYSDGDGVSLVHPLGITGITFDLETQVDQISGNNSSPIGRVVQLSRLGSDGWATGYSQAAVTSGIEAVSSQNPTFSSPYPDTVAFAVWPPDGSDTISRKAKVDRQVYGGWKSSLSIAIDTSKLTITQTQAEESIGDLATVLRIGGGASPVAPYRIVRIGGDKTRRYATRLNEVLIIDGNTRSAKLWNSGKTAVVETVPVNAIDATMLLAGESSERVTDRWLPIAPDANTTVYLTQTNGGTTDATIDYTPSYL